MRINTILTLVAATLACKVTADCFAEKYGYPCCSETKDVIAIENGIKLGIENGTTCAIEPIIALKRRSEDKCAILPVGADYMDKLEITNLCPAEALEKQKNIKYPTAQKVSYYSKYTEEYKQMNVILPVNYTEQKKYPVLYLLHGFMADEDAFLQLGADTIPTYLAKQGKAKEMIVVLPNEYTPAPGKAVAPDITSPEYAAGYDTFINDMLESIMPYMEEHYSVATGRENTAIGGFSMGGRNTLYIALKRPDLFGYVGAFSPAPGVVPADDWTGHHEGLMTEAEFGFEKNAPYVTLINCGDADTAVGTFPKEYHELFIKHGNDNVYFEVPGANHDDVAVAAGLYNFVQTAFGALNSEEAAPIGANYTDKLEITNLCPDEARYQQEGIEYPTPQKVTYYSKYTEKEKQMNVILPVGYSEDKKYPVLYLLHGIMADEDTLLQVQVGADTIPTYLAKQGKAKEMIVVLPNEYTPAPGKEVAPDITSKEYAAGYDTFINDLVDSIMPYMEEHYSVATGKENTAISGFSMGGRNALYIAIKRPDLFGYVGAFAPAPGVIPADDWTGHHDGLMTEEEFGYENKSPYFTLISCGDSDTAVATFPKEYHELFERNGTKSVYMEVPGADHDNVAVAAGLYNFVQTAFGALEQDPECALADKPYIKYVTKTKVVTKTAKATKTVKVTKTAKVTKTKTAVKTKTVKKTKKVVKTVTKN